MNEKGDYELSNLCPPLDQDKTAQLLHSLNAGGKDGFNMFVVGMSEYIGVAVTGVCPDGCDSEIIRSQSGCVSRGTTEYPGKSFKETLQRKM